MSLFQPAEARSCTQTAPLPSACAAADASANLEREGQPTRAELLAQVERQHQAMQELLESFNEIVAERDAARLLNELCHY